jgi:hypothetical protein
VFIEPLAQIVEALTAASNAQTLANHLPDVSQLADLPASSARV